MVKKVLSSWAGDCDVGREDALLPQPGWASHHHIRMVCTEVLQPRGRDLCSPSSLP